MPDLDNARIELVAGFSSGVLTTLVGHPLDVIKTRLQGRLAPPFIVPVRYRRRPSTPTRGLSLDDPSSEPSLKHDTSSNEACDPTLMSAQWTVSAHRHAWARRGRSLATSCGAKAVARALSARSIAA